MSEPARSSAAGKGWPEANRDYLMAALGVVEARLRRPEGGEDAVTGAEARLAAAAAELPGPAAVETLAQTFGLSDFERELLLFAAGPQLSGSFGELCGASSGRTAPAPTFGLALERLPGAHWSAITPEAPLRRWRMIEPDSATDLTQGTLRIDERILHYLAGIDYQDPRLRGWVRPLATPPEDAAGVHAAAVNRLVGAIANWPDRQLPVVLLCGGRPEDARWISGRLCAHLGVTLHGLQAGDLPAAVEERDALARLWQREAVLRGSALLVESPDEAAAPRTGGFVSSLSGLVIVAAGGRIPLDGRPSLRIDVEPPAFDGRRRLWGETMLALGLEAPAGLDRLAQQFRLGADGIREAVSEALCRPDSEPLEDRLWEACRARTRYGLETLAQRIPPRASWEQLVLPPEQIETLEMLAEQVRHQVRVYETWGFSAQSGRGLGISALFVGSSGTGKTLAAEVLANHLELDLYRIDLSQVVSKYIGETEKNLGRVFDSADDGGAILLFDEADALFGKRSEVKDSHDRYANIEISYLLQRMEEYRGLAILTTNLMDVLDKAFLRRIRFVLRFPFPEAELRAEIWRRIFPPQTPTNGLDWQKLARLNVAGGNIRNIAVQAAFLAAAAEQPVGMRHLLRAARVEFAKLNRPLTSAEVAGWV